MTIAPPVLVYTTSVVIQETATVTVPSKAPCTFTPPDLDVYAGDVGVHYATGSQAMFANVPSNPAQGQYAIVGGVYVFSTADAGQQVAVVYDAATAVRVDAQSPPFTQPTTRVTLAVAVTQLCPPGWPCPPDQIGVAPVPWFPGRVIPAGTTIGAYRCVANALIAAGAAVQA